MNIIHGWTLQHVKQYKMFGLKQIGKGMAKIVTSEYVKQMEFTEKCLCTEINL